MTAVADARSQCSGITRLLRCSTSTLHSATATSNAHDCAASLATSHAFNTTEAARQSRVVPLVGSAPVQGTHRAGSAAIECCLTSGTSAGRPDDRGDPTSLVGPNRPFGDPQPDGHVDEPCRRTMSTNHVDEPCRRTMWRHRPLTTTMRADCQPYCLIVSHGSIILSGGYPKVSDASPPMGGSLHLTVV